MAVCDLEQGAMPRSALRYRPLAARDQAQSGRVVTRTRRQAPDDDLEGNLAHSPRRRAVVAAPSARFRRRLHPLGVVGLALLLAVLVWIGVTQVVTWGTNALNTLTYGNPRTFQMDAVVGDGDSIQHPSHFIAVNLRGVVTILVFPAGDASQTRVLASTTLVGPDASQAVVTLRFVDVTHTGHPDLLIDIAGVQSLLVNDQGTFRAPTPTEQQSIFRDLQHIEG